MTPNLDTLDTLDTFLQLNPHTRPPEINLENASNASNASTATPVAVVTAHFDGLCEPVNPGGVACGGWYVEPNHAAGIPGPISGHRCYGRGMGMTNNYAEYEAALDALRAIYRTGYRGRVCLRGDSKLVVNQVTGEWQCNKPHLQQLCEKVRDAMSFFEWVVLEWVSREQNALADAESRLAYREMTGRDVPERRRAS
jgi:ribonuclease HI